MGHQRLSVPFEVGLTCKYGYIQTIKQQRRDCIPTVPLLKVCPHGLEQLWMVAVGVDGCRLLPPRAHHQAMALPKITIGMAIQAYSVSLCILSAQYVQPTLQVSHCLVAIIPPRSFSLVHSFSPLYPFNHAGQQQHPTH